MAHPEIENYNRMMTEGVLINDADKLKQIWDFCDEEQRIIYTEGCQNTVFQQGYIIALRKIQHKINNRCSDLSSINANPKIIT